MINWIFFYGFSPFTFVVSQSIFRYWLPFLWGIPGKGFSQSRFCRIPANTSYVHAPKAFNAGFPVSDTILPSGDNTYRFSGLRTACADMAGCLRTINILCWRLYKISVEMRPLETSFHAADYAYILQYQTSSVYLLVEGLIILNLLYLSPIIHQFLLQFSISLYPIKTTTIYSYTRRIKYFYRFPMTSFF